jgi:acetyl-CoA C-acetyltransferase
MLNKAVYITHAKRTAVGSLLGALSGIPAVKLGAIVMRAILDESKIDRNLINEVILGQVIAGGAGQNPARQTLIEAGLSKEVPGFTINKVCGSGMKAVTLAASSIALGQNEIVIAGGQENMSLGMHATYLRAGLKLGNAHMLDLTQNDGLTDAFSGLAMGVTAENVAKLFDISREEQDAFALDSHKKAASAISRGIFKQEIVPLEIRLKKELKIFDTDEGVRTDSNLEVLSKLRPVFNATDGSVTAGNASSINDGAAALLMASEEAVKANKLTPIARIVSFASAGVDPNIMGIGPVPASKTALELARWNLQDIDLIESNEAFAASSIAVNRQMNWDLSKLNVNGGAIALGHPIGASGARILTGLIHQMKRQNAKKGLATMCIGGGMGIAICIESL